MDIHFISTLTPEDEDRFGPMIVNTIKAILEATPISYTLRIQTANGRTFQHAKADELESEAPEIGRSHPGVYARRASLS